MRQNVVGAAVNLILILMALLRRAEVTVVGIGQVAHPVIIFGLQRLYLSIVVVGLCVLLSSPVIL